MKTIAKFFIALTALLGLSGAASANNYDVYPESKIIKFVARLHDYNTGLPLQGVKMKVLIYDTALGRICSDLTQYDDSRRLLLMTTNPSDADGVCYAFSNPINSTTKHMTSETGADFWLGNNAISNVYNFQIVPASDGFDYHYPLVKGKVRTLDRTTGYKWSTSGVSAVEYDNNTFNPNWDTDDGVGHVDGAVAVYDVYLEFKGLTVAFDRSKISNQSDFPDAHFTTPTPSYTLPTATPVYALHPTWNFDCWKGSDGNDYAAGATLTVYDNITFTPKWINPNPPQGIIRFHCYMWDHAGYLNDPKSHKPITSTVVVTGKNTGYKVNGSYTYEEFNSNLGWTTIPVEGATMILKTYNDNGPAPDIKSRKPVGYAPSEYAADWQDNSDISRVTTDANGEATYTISAERLQNLLATDRIDCDPDKRILGYVDRGLGFGREQVVCDWDWMTADVVGVVGVRRIYQGERWEDLGVHLSQSNNNDVMALSTELIEEGFEFDWYCYLCPSTSVVFEVNGGEMPSGTDPSLYPLQIIKPITMATPYEESFARNPGTPTHPTLPVFAGWHQVYNDGTVDPEPYNFNRPVTQSIRLRALYAEATYTARWAPEGWRGASESSLYEKTEGYTNGSNPTYDLQTLPTKTPGNYEFSGWNLYVKDDAGDVSFGSLGKYRLSSYIPQTSMVKVIVDPNTGTFYYKSPVAIAGADVIYEAVFTAGNTVLTIKKSGLANGDSALFNVTKGDVKMQVILTGTGSGTVSQTVILPEGGTWTVSEDMNWTWAYTNSQSTKNVTIEAGQIMEVSFTNTPKGSTVKHAEAMVKNVFTKTK